MSQGELRLLNASDVGNYRDMRLRALQSSTMSFSESYEDEARNDLNYFASCMGLSSEHFTVGFFDQNQQLIGVATFKRDQRSKARHKSYIHTMYVDPSHRNQKIGARILSDLIQRAKEMSSLEQIHLWVLNPEISAARHLYAKNGFIGQGTIVRRDLKINGIFVDAEYMTLDLER